MAIYQVDIKSGKLTNLLQFIADFSQEDACLNQCVLSFDNSCIVTGGDDSVVRLFRLSKDFKELSGQAIEFKGASMAITGVDICRDNSRIVATSKDQNAYVFDVKSKQIVDKLCFKCRLDTKNMIMRACSFRRDGCVYTLCTQARDPTFLIKWRPSGQKYQPETTEQVHEKPSTGMRLSQNG